jgi:hypothetical protein
MMLCKILLTSLLFLGLCLSVSRNALASSTWFVNGLTGNDNYSCKSTAASCKTIGHAISKSSPGDSIAVAAGTYTENLAIPRALSIVGVDARTTIIDGAQHGSVVTISNPSTQVALSGLTIRNGLDHSRGGGGIYNAGTLTLTNTTISGNRSDDTLVVTGGLGGGIYNSGTLTMVQSTVSGNTAWRFRIANSAAGGGIYNTGKLTITNSTVTANLATAFWPAGVTYGGGLASKNGTVVVSNSTLSQNSAILRVPFGTYGALGGGIYNSGASILTLQNSIVAGNTLGGNCMGGVHSNGHNLSSDSTCNLNGPGDQKNINPDLGALWNNGGSTQTMALLAGSPAMNAGNPSGCYDSSGHRLMTDQRGHPRPSYGACDMGAYNH